MCIRDRASEAILKIQKIAISPQRNDRFGRNLVQLCVCALQTPSANNISQIWKSKMAAAAIFKNRKILISSQLIDWFWENLAWRCVSNLWILTTNKILRFQKSKMAAAAILKIQEIKCSNYDDFIRINFKVICRLQSFSNGMFCGCRICTDSALRVPSALASAIPEI